MRQCLKCQHVFTSDQSGCLKCGHSVVKIDGIDAYAPELSQKGGGFKAEYFAELAELEEGHFWFRARNEILLWVLSKYAPHFDSLLEIGCGTAFVLSGVAAAFPNAHLVGSEIFSDGLSIAKQRVNHATFLQMDARAIPFVEEFDVIGAFDVLEHIEDDEKVLEQMHKALKPKGMILVTVPQHQWLWSPSDDYAMHARRYTRHELQKKVVSAGFEIVRTTSFVSLLLPLMIASRLRSRKQAVFVAKSEFQLSKGLNRALYEVLRCELMAIRCGLAFPYGGSRLVVAKKL